MDEVTNLSTGLNCHFSNEQGMWIRCISQNDKPIAPKISTKEKPKHVTSNETSILTALNASEDRCDAMLTGDSTAKEIMPHLSKNVGILQVPHHGSSINSTIKDETRLREFADRYGLQSNKKELKEILECALFYDTFRAQCYLISAGGTLNYKHPGSSVLQGIIVANALRTHSCVIVATNSRGLDSEKLNQLHKLLPQHMKKWTEWVKIYHYSDVFIQTETETQCHTLIRPAKVC